MTEIPGNLPSINGLINRYDEGFNEHRASNPDLYFLWEEFKKDAKESIMAAYLKPFSKDEPKDVKLIAEQTYLRITSFSPRKELGGIEREWIVKKIAESLQSALASTEAKLKSAEERAEKLEALLKKQIEEELEKTWARSFKRAGQDALENAKVILWQKFQQHHPSLFKSE